MTEGYVSDLENEVTPPASPPPVNPAGTPAPPISGAPYSSDLENEAPVGKTGSHQQHYPIQKMDRVPAWSEIPELQKSNAANSAMHFGENTYNAFAHPINTLSDVGSLAMGLVQKAGILPKDNWKGNYEQYPDAVGKMLVEDYGSIDNFKKKLATDPIGVLADASAVLMGGGGLLARTPGIAGKVGEVVRATGNVIDPLNAVTKPASAITKPIANAAGTAASEIMGWRSGAGPEAIQTAAKAGYEGGEGAQAFRENLRGKVPLEGVVEQAQGSLSNMVEGKNKAYQDAMKAAGMKPPLLPEAYKSIGDTMRKAEEYGSLPGWKYSAAAEEVNNALKDKVIDFMANRTAYHTPEGLDALKKQIGEYRNTIAKDNTIGHAVASIYYDGIRDAIIRQVPKYAPIMKTYEEAGDALRQLRSTFSLPANQRRVVTETALRKLQSVMRNNVNTSYGFRSTLMEMLEKNGAPHLREALAGQALAPRTPRGLARISAELGAETATSLFSLFSHQPEILWPALGAAATTAITSSPRVLGNMAYYSGKAAKPIKNITSRPSINAAQQAGKLEGIEHARGGAVDRAIRLSRKH